MNPVSQHTRTDRVVASQRPAAVDGNGVLNRARSILDLEAAAVVDARDRLGDAFVAAVDMIHRCRGRVCVTGVGKAGLIGRKIQATLASTGTLAYGLHPVEALHGDLGMIHKQDVVLALSKSGGSELVELLPRLGRLGCAIVLITANPKSPAARHADHVLDIGQTPEACPLGLAPSSSTAAMLALGDALALCVMELKHVDPEQYAGYHPGGSLGRYLLKAHEIMRVGADCPRVDVSATLGACCAVIQNAPHRAGAAAIVDGDGKLVGILTQGDFFRLFNSPDHSPDIPVARVMTRTPKSVRRHDRVVDALAVMRRYAIDELPVVDADGALAGMIDIQDLMSRGFGGDDAGEV
ncbi:MAG: SIS domain-containing protein [Phycisphaerae bacterium]